MRKPTITLCVALFNVVLFIAILGLKSENTYGQQNITHSIKLQNHIEKRKNYPKIIGSKKHHLFSKYKNIGKRKVLTNSKFSVRKGFDIKNVKKEKSFIKQGAIKFMIPINKKKIALLAPLSGDFSLDGSDIVSSVKFALHSSHIDGIELTVINEGSEHKIRKESIPMLSNVLPDIIIGPLLPEHVEAVAKFAVVHNTPVISLVDDEGMPNPVELKENNYGKLYRLGIARSNQAKAIVEYWYNRNNDTHYKRLLYAIVPDGPFQHIFSGFIEDFKKKNQDLSMVLFTYRANSADLENDTALLLKKIIFDLENKLQDGYVSQTLKTDIAIFIAGNEWQLKNIMYQVRINPLLRENNVQVIGAGYMLTTAIQQSSLGDAFIADISKYSKAFGDNFFHATHSIPSRIALVAYDGVLTAIEKMKSHHSANHKRTSLFIKGATGPLQINDDGSSFRYLSIYKMSSGKIDMVKYNARLDTKD